MQEGYAYREVTEAAERSAVCERVLRALPGWFGIEEALVGYVREAAGLPVYAAFDGGEAVGFVALKRHTAFAQEVCVMGVLPECHRKGVGRALIDWCASTAKEQGARFLTVKTLADLHPDEGYARTRAFYLAMGFVPIEVFTEIWDEDNPCLYSVMPL